MPRFRKKPVVVCAVNTLAIVAAVGVWGEWEKLEPWVRRAHDRGMIALDNGCIFVETPEGRMRANAGDWLILGVKGEVYPCKPDIFEATYEPVE